MALLYLACAFNKSHLIFRYEESSFGDLLHFLCHSRQTQQEWSFISTPQKTNHWKWPYAINAMVISFSSFLRLPVRFMLGFFSSFTIIMWLLLKNLDDIYSFLMHSLLFKTWQLYRCTSSIVNENRKKNKTNIGKTLPRTKN